MSFGCVVEGVLLPVALEGVLGGGVPWSGGVSFCPLRVVYTLQAEGFDRLRQSGKALREDQGRYLLDKDEIETRSILELETGLKLSTREPPHLFNRASTACTDLFSSTSLIFDLRKQDWCCSPLTLSYHTQKTRRQCNS